MAGLTTILVLFSSWRSVYSLSEDTAQAMPLTYSQALAYIHSFDDPYLAAIRNHGQQTWGLDRIRARLAELGNPHLVYPTIHVAGTKGKGSTAAFIAQGLVESGLKTGLYTSPHLQDWRERLQINGQWITEQQLTQIVEDYHQIITAVEGLSAFEVGTALAFWHFARQGCDIAVIEVGLGGRLDATSVVEPVISVITNISLDHTQLLGDTLEQIAGEKAAIIKRSVPVISGPQQPSALAVIEACARQMDSPVTIIGRNWKVHPLLSDWNGSDFEVELGEEIQRIHIGLAGAVQIENAAVAFAALKAAQQAGIPVKDGSILQAMSEMRWPGRLELVRKNPLVVLDGAHNPYSIARLVESLSTLDDFATLTVVFGCMADKQVDAMLAALLPACRRIIFTQADNIRAATPDDLMNQAATVIAGARIRGELWARSIRIESAPDVGSAINLALASLPDEDALCITGSLAIVGEARTILFAMDDENAPLASEANQDDNPKPE